MQKLKKLQWSWHMVTSSRRINQLLQKGKATPYPEELIVKLRDIDYRGIPASVILLSHKLCAGHCHDRALLLTKAFLDTADDINLLNININSLRFNPTLKPSEWEHCVLERTTPTGQTLIYDTTDGLVYTKKDYWAIENPTIKSINRKKQIIDFIENYEPQYLAQQKDLDFYQNALKTIKRSLTPNNNKKNNFEFYAQPSMKLLQREFRLFQNKIREQSLEK